VDRLRKTLRFRFQGLWYNNSMRYLILLLICLTLTGCSSLAMPLPREHLIIQELISPNVHISGGMEPLVCDSWTPTQDVEIVGCLINTAPASGHHLRKQGYVIGYACLCKGEYSSDTLGVAVCMETLYGTADKEYGDYSIMFPPGYAVPLKAGEALNLYLHGNNLSDDSQWQFSARAQVYFARK